ncbi:hypothetical protein V8C43DRAFT_281987 [Trichoderma afarasin]
MARRKKLVPSIFMYFNLLYSSLLPVEHLHYSSYHLQSHLCTEQSTFPSCQRVWQCSSQCQSFVKSFFLAATPLGN